MKKTSLASEQWENTFEFIFNSVYPLTPEVIEAMVLLLKSNVENFSFCEYKCELSEDIISRDTTISNSSKAILVKGYDKSSALDIEALFYRNTHTLTIKAKDGTNTMRTTEKEAYFTSYCRSLEIMAHSYIRIGECYTKLFKAARAYVNSNYDKRLAEFNDDGYSLNLAFLYSPPQKE